MVLPGTNLGNGRDTLLVAIRRVIALTTQTKYSDGKMSCFRRLISQRSPQRNCSSERSASHSEFFANVFVLGLPTDFGSGTRRKTLKHLKVHLYNAPSHNSKRLEKLERQLAPPECPDIAPSDYELFDHLKKKLYSVAVADGDRVTSTMLQLSIDTQEDELIAVWQDWMKRLRWVIKNERRYYKPETTRTRIRETSATVVLTIRNS
jgi:hypothetical protein